jgi:NAD(P)-dependent dehydrogenase (short-subunit alcohol dehydrogenase family)
VTTTAVVTGANQGLGLALAAGLADRLGRDSNIYLTGRDPDRVALAVRRLRDAGLHVLGERVDVRSTTAVNRFAALAAHRHSRADLVISNAAARITPERPQAEQVATFVDTNNLGTTRMIRAFAPLLAPGGRYLIVASAFGSLRNLPPQLHERFDTADMSLEDLDCQKTQFSDAVREGRADAEGWPGCSTSLPRSARWRQCASSPASNTRSHRKTAASSPPSAPASSTPTHHDPGSRTCHRHGRTTKLPPRSRPRLGPRRPHALRRTHPAPSHRPVEVSSAR